MGSDLSEVLLSLDHLSAEDLIVVGTTAMNRARESAIRSGDISAVMKDAHDRLFRDGGMSAPIIYGDSNIVAVGNMIEYKNRKSRRHVCYNSVVSINGSDPSYIWDTSFPAFLESESSNVGDFLYSSALFMLVEDLTVTEREMKYDGVFHTINNVASWRIESDKLVRDDHVDVSRLPPPRESEETGGGDTAPAPAASRAGRTHSRRMSPAEKKARNR